MSYLLIYYMGEIINLDIKKFKNKFVFSGLDSILVSNPIMSWGFGNFYFFTGSESLNEYVDLLKNSSLKYNVKNFLIKDLVGNYCVNLNYVNYREKSSLILPFRQRNLVGEKNLSVKISEYISNFGNNLVFNSSKINGCYFTLRL